jgi:hypothetical protein
MNISVKVMGRKTNNPGYVDYIDFCVFINGECDNNLYRKYIDEKTFHKTVGFSGYGKCVRGKKRAVVEMLLEHLEKVELPVAMAII